MARSVLLLAALAILSHNTFAYYDIGDASLPKVTVYEPTIPHRLHSIDQTARVAGAAMITAVAPSISLLPNGNFETYYSMHFQSQVPQKKIGKGVFERGVFASDPPFPTCNVCDANGNALSTQTSFSATASSGGPSCTIVPYGGVFRDPDPAKTTFCFDTSYTGVFSTTIPYTYVLPCCPSCAPNSTTSSTSRPITTGVLVTTTTFTTNGIASTFSASSSTLPSNLLSRSSSSSSSRSPSLSSQSTSSKAASSMTTTSRSSLTSRIPTLGPVLASPATSPSTSSTRPITSVVVISSTTIIIGPPSSGSSSALSTITVITATSATTTPAITSDVAILAPDTIIGCGTAVSGCGTVIGSGVVYLDTLGLLKVTSVGTAIGCAPKVVGCGTMLATTGTFSGSATIYGCGTASGTATLIGAGTVWPAIGGGLISFVSRGTIVGSGSVVGCGTIIGSGAFTATAPFSVSIPTTVTPTKTVEVYVSYCPTTMPGYAMPRIGANVTSDPNNTIADAPYRMANSTVVNSTYPVFNATLNTTDPVGNVTPPCKWCPGDSICCAWEAICNPDGKCPHWAVVAMGYWRFDMNVAQKQNLSDGTQGPVVTDTEMRMIDGVGSMEMGEGSGEKIGDGLLMGMSGGKVETALMLGTYPMGNAPGNGNGTSARTGTKGNETSPWNGFVVEDDNVFYSH